MGTLQALPTHVLPLDMETDPSRALMGSINDLLGGLPFCFSCGLMPFSSSIPFVTSLPSRLAGRPYWSFPRCSPSIRLWRRYSSRDASWTSSLSINSSPPSSAFAIGAFTSHLPSSNFHVFFFSLIQVLVRFKDSSLWLNGRRDPFKRLWPKILPVGGKSK